MLLPPVPPEFVEWLQPYPESVQEVALAARSMLVAVAPDALEFVADSVNAVAMGLTYTKSFMQQFAHVATYSMHVNLGFDYGVNLDDPEGRLVGSGSRVRHITLRSLSDLEDPYIRGLVEQAHRNALHPAVPLPRQTVLLRYENAKKRRPAGTDK